MRVFVLTAVLATMLAPAICLAADETPAPPGPDDIYTLSVRQYAKGEIVGEAYYGPLDINDPIDVLQICSPRGDGGATDLMPVCYLLALNPAARATLTAGMEGRMRESLKGFAQPPLRELQFWQWRIYYYFPNADEVEFAIVRTAPGVSAIADGDWGGEFQGEVTARLIVMQQAEVDIEEEDEGDLEETGK